jgi:hypothetical protein
MPKGSRNREAPRERIARLRAEEARRRRRRIWALSTGAAAVVIAAAIILAKIGIPGAQARETTRGPFVANGTCFYWLHTHVADGIIHVESPVQRTYNLGDFFDEWGQPLGPGHAGPATGRVVALYNGKVYLGNPRDIPLTSHAQIQLDVGTPLIAPQPVSFPAGL